MDLRSHSCPRCEWLILGSRTGHSPFPEENKRFEDEFKRRFAKMYGTLSDPTAHEDTTRCFWGYRQDEQWDFCWPIGYRADHGECELLKSFINCFRNEHDLNDSDIFIDQTLWGSLQRDVRDGDDEARLHVELHNGAGVIVSEAPNNVSCRSIELELFDPMGGFGKQRVPTRPVQLRPETDSSFRLMKSWIQHCITEHVQSPAWTGVPGASSQASVTHCSSTPSYNPKRLLHVDSEASGCKLSLINSKISLPEFVPYVALSYCWGGDQPFKTTKASIRTNMPFIDYHQMPATIQDACRTTRKLGYSYLWIDALCIIQDDEVEMQREVANMKHIYSNAILTIVASRAKSSLEGFLQTRKPATSVFPLRMRAVGRDETVSEMNLMVSLHRDAQPLDRRAWALQESLLSTRFIDFTSAVTRFYCATSRAHPRPVSYRPDGYRGHRSENVIAQAIAIFPTKFANLDGAHRFWWDVVLMYTSREMSVPSDRPLAIAGLAERLCQQMVHLADAGIRNTYIAGHWSLNLSQSLDWLIDGRLEPRPTKYQGPSWSWLSVSSTVKRPYMLKKGSDNTGHATIELYAYGVSLRQEKARFGAVTSATLDVKCNINPVMLKYERPVPDEDQTTALHFRNKIFASRGHDATSEHRKKWLQTHMRFDTMTELFQNRDEEEVFFMQIREDAGTGVLDAIVLQLDSTINGMRRFVRIGYCRVRYRENGDENWTQGWSREVIQLI